MKTIQDRIVEIMNHWDDGSGGKYLTIYRGKLSTVAAELTALFTELHKEIQDRAKATMRLKK